MADGNGPNSRTDERQRRHVTPEEYLKLAVSTRELSRADSRVHGHRGLRDKQTGCTYLVCEHALFRWYESKSFGRNRQACEQPKQ